MATRSVIARYTLNTPTEWEGTYCHWDGYPNHMGEQLRMIVSRDGYQLAGNTIMQYEWSAIEALRTREEWIEMRSDAWTIVEGYGIAYNGSRQIHFTSDDPQSLINSWCEYLYIITPENMIEVHRIVDGEIKQIESLRADVPMSFFQTA